MKEKKWNKYQESTLNNKVQNLLLEFLNKYNHIQSVIDLGCGAGNETVYLLKKGYKVVAIDKELNESFIFDRINNQERHNLSYIKSEFENVNIPLADCILAMFSIPFCNPNYFDELWDKIYKSINNNGYFVGQLFGNRDDYSATNFVNTFTKEEVINKLSKYNILLFDEIEYINENTNKKWHYFNIIARKM